MPKVTLEAARVNAGLSQKELADILGVTNITISSWERGRTEPSFSQLKKISELSGFPIDCLEICKKKEEWLIGIPVLILGESGSGKSTSMRNFEKEEVGIFNVAGKPLPFKKKLNKVNNATYGTILKVLSNPGLKKYVIDDSQYLMAFESFDHAKETGYGKFTNMALNFRNLIDFVVRKTTDDVIVYFLHHTERTDDGRLKAKTLGKMLDNQLTVEGLFSIVLLCQVEGSEHYFITNSDGSNPAKSPMDMFEMKIDNDLKMVDETIREYYELEKGEEKHA